MYIPSLMPSSVALPANDRVETSGVVSLSQRVAASAPARASQADKPKQPPMNPQDVVLAFTLLFEMYSAAWVQMTPQKVLQFLNTMPNHTEEFLAFPSLSSQSEALGAIRTFRTTDVDGKPLPLNEDDEKFIQLLKDAHVQLIGVEFFFNRLSNTIFLPDEDNGDVELEKDW